MEDWNDDFGEDDLIVDAISEAAEAARLRLYARVSKGSLREERLDAADRRSAAATALLNSWVASHPAKVADAK